MNSNKIGKYILMLSAPVFLLSMFGLFFNYIPRVFGTNLILSSYVLFCSSFSFIFYHSTILKRNKAIKIISIISGFVFLIGWWFKFMYWPGASVLVITSNLLFSFGCLPLIMKYRYEKRITLVSEKTLLLTIADMISISLIITGLLFRILHWYGANHLIICGAIILGITFIFWNISFRKEVKLRLVAEEKLKYTLNEVEEKQKILKDRVLLLGQTLIDTKDKSSKDIQELKRTVLDLKEENKMLKSSIQKIMEQINSSARKEDLIILQRQFDLFRNV